MLQIIIPVSYDKEKWKKAADACLDAIQAAEAAGFSLYKNSTFNSALPSNPVEKDLRLTFIDRNNREVIWGETRQEGYYQLQNKSTPFTDGSGAWNGVAPTLSIMDQFYTVNGLPIDKDPNFDYQGRYFIVAGPLGNTLKYNLGRELRFNAWIAYHNSTYEIVRGGANSIVAQFRKNDNCGIKARSNNYAPTGYLNKKGVAPTYAQTGLMIPPQYA